MLSVRGGRRLLIGFRLPDGWRPSRMDMLLALAVVVAGQVESFGRQGLDPGQVRHPVPLAAGAVVAGALLALRRRSPVGTLLVLMAVGAAVRVVTGGLYYPAWHFYSTLILVHTVAGAAELRSRRGAAGLASVLTAYLFLQAFQYNDLAEVLISAVFIGVAYVSGILLRRQIDQTLRLARRTARLEAEREEQARRAVDEERARIARELHDIVSHNVSLMTLQAGGVRTMLGEEARRERDLLLNVERAGREAVEELRLMLGMLRDPGGTGVQPPSAGLDGLDALVAQVKDTGVAVGVGVKGRPRPLPPGLDLSAYRVVQEALTNALKHARAGRIDVTVTHSPGALVLEVVDDGTGDGGGQGSGHGLIGMRERVAMYGGELTAGPTPGGRGYRVHARFPLG
ncbi:sensor histidine kinase [Streptosporangium carneum]|uniref:histidine kinase n=1 Tax=Streptosporangium carneum TaxID=47481 RepID=A0A9W6MAX0_9ACTN|nr:histidine kinase [Streptosporangium carneum]GLK07437.1 two-component sensor histidine kinase [Streptosporangium carneum]